MYAVYRQAHTPTAVEFSVYCNFISSEEKNLVVAGTSQLYVYRIIHDVEVSYNLISFSITFQSAGQSEEHLDLTVFFLCCVFGLLECQQDGEVFG